jgi:signal transduction histidine kinase/CheY-like chemotaxis protein
MKRDGHSERVLVWTRSPRDTQLAVQILEKGDLAAVRCDSAEDLESGIDAGAGCAVVAEEVLTRAAREKLTRRLEAQPPWSDFPFVLLSAERTSSGDGLGNVTRLDRPVRVATLLSAVRAALRGRRRQYQAEEAIRRRDQFLAMLGHELRNPLGAIVVAVEILHRIGGPEGQKQRGIIERQSRHLARLVDDLLDVARVTSGKVVLHRAPLDLDDLVRRCLQAAEPSARAKSIQVGFQPSREPLTVEGDALRLEQVVSNLVVNAIKYSPARSAVQVSTHREGDDAVIRVADEGIGIAPELLDRIFDMFVQAESSLDRAEGGMGIGLTLVKSLVELHGGTVAVHSQGRGKGSEFVCRLPLPPGPVAVAEARAPAAVARAPLRIVLVEDNADIRESLRDYLEALGYELWTAADGPSGLASILERRPQVALVDIGLPILDGYEVAQKVREKLGSDVRLVAVTGYGQAEDRQRALSAGFDEHMRKPLELSALEDLLVDLAAGHGRTEPQPRP